MKWLIRFLVFMLAQNLFGQNQTVVSNVSIKIVQHSAQLSWVGSASTGVVGYNVYRTLTTGTGYAKIGSTSVAVLTYTDGTVLAGKTYFYVVRTWDGSNESGNSNQVTAVIPTP